MPTWLIPILASMAQAAATPKTTQNSPAAALAPLPSPPQSQQLKGPPQDLFNVQPIPKMPDFQGQAKPYYGFGPEMQDQIMQHLTNLGFF